MEQRNWKTAVAGHRPEGFTDGIERPGILLLKG